MVKIAPVPSSYEDKRRRKDKDISVYQDPDSYFFDHVYVSGIMIVFANMILKNLIKQEITD